MFFWKSITVNKILIYKASLQTCHEQIDPKISDRQLNPKREMKAQTKRTFSFAPSAYKASMCVEASLSFSFFLLFLVQVFSMLLFFKIYTQDMAQLQQKGKKLAAYACTTQGFEGDNTELIRLQNSKKIEALFPILAFSDCKLITKCVVKPWTGYDVTTGKTRKDEDTIVYMTQYGTVYHRDRSCTHLSLSIQGVEISGIKEMENESGGHYSPCEYCGGNGFVTLVFVTNYGNRYHTSLSCRGLKRQIRSIPLSEVGAAAPCKKCGG